MKPGKTLDWDFIKSCLRVRRFARIMEQQGYRRHETDWEIHRGSRFRDET